MPIVSSARQGGACHCSGAVDFQGGDSRQARQAVRFAGAELEPPAVLVPAGRSDLPRKREQHRRREECDRSEAIVWNAGSLDKYAARPGPADVPSGQKPLATLAPVAESTVAVMSARPVRHPPAPPSNAR